MIVKHLIVRRAHIGRAIWDILYTLAFSLIIGVYTYQLAVNLNDRSSYQADLMSRCEDPTHKDWSDWECTNW